MNKLKKIKDAIMEEWEEYLCIAVAIVTVVIMAIVI